MVLGKADSGEVKAGVGRFERALAADGRFGPVTKTVSPDRELTLLLVPVSADALSSEAISAVKALRHTFVPQAFAASGAHVLVTGKTAENVDYFYHEKPA